MTRAKRVRRGSKYTVPDDQALIQATGVGADGSVTVHDYDDDAVYVESSIGIARLDNDTFDALVKAQ